MRGLWTLWARRRCPSAVRVPVVAVPSPLSRQSTVVAAASRHARSGRPAARSEQSSNDCDGEGRGPAWGLPTGRQEGSMQFKEEGVARGHLARTSLVKLPWRMPIHERSNLRFHGLSGSELETNCTCPEFIHVAQTEFHRR
jgi:hypothetical protein